MADLHEPDVGTAYYRSTDPVKNIKFSVKLDRVTSSSIVPQGGGEGHAGSAAGSVPGSRVGSQVEMRDLAKQGIKDHEEGVVSWQQKIFSQREIEKYSNKDNCQSPIDMKYHNEVTALFNFCRLLIIFEKPMNMYGRHSKFKERLAEMERQQHANFCRDRGKQTNRIFTYVDHDAFTQQDEITEFLTSSPNEQPSFLTEKMSHVRKRRIGGAKQKREKENAFVPKLNVIEDNPTEELLSKNHLLAAPVQVMHIMGDLSPRERMATDDDEVVLCTIKIDAGGVLSIHPDFNRGRKAYIAESNVDYAREVFEYTIEHASKEMNRQEQDREMKMYREVYARHKDFLTACVGHEFELPPPNVLRLLVYGEIESVKDFEFDDLYLHFFVDLPKYWSAERHQQLSWVTQTCATKVQGRDDVAYFSFPFNFELFYKNESLDEEEQGEIPHFPSVLLEVLSLDTWNRFRTEGYTHFTIPGTPGVHKNTVHCWRPVGSTIVSELRRFFIGGSPELEDPTYTAIPSTFQGSHLSKFAFKTETTGSVNVKLNVILQSRAFKDKKANKQSLGSLLETLGINAVQQNISNVLDAFKKARQRMLQARESATQDLMKGTTSKSVMA